jgi:hypothetical protein
MKYDIWQIQVRLGYRDNPQVELPDNAVIVLGKYATVPMEEKPNCATQGIEIVFLTPAEEKQAGA